MDRALAFAFPRQNRRRLPSDTVKERIAQRLNAQSVQLVQPLDEGAGPLSSPCCGKACCKQFAHRQTWTFEDRADGRDTLYEVSAWSDDDGHWLCARSCNERRGYPHIVVQREAAIAPFNADDAGQLASILPDLLSCIAAGYELAQIRKEASYVGRLFDTLPLPILLISDQLKVLAANEAGADILQKGDGLSESQGKLRLDGPVAEELRLVFTKGMDAQSHVDVARPSGAAPYILSLFVTGPMPHHEEMVTGALIIRDPQALPQNPSSLSMRAFNFTKAEARLAHRLLEGHSLASAAEALGISQNTARTHMKRIYSKTGTHRQTELMRILLRMAVEA